jgi:hypothetical protein
MPHYCSTGLEAAPQCLSPVVLRQGNCGRTKHSQTDFATAVQPCHESQATPVDNLPAQAAWTVKGMVLPPIQFNHLC